MKFAATFVSLLSFISTALAVSFIVPGAVWTDTNGAKILAHGGHVIKVGTTFYWLGYSVAANVQPNIYSSTDLMNWAHVGIASTAVSQMYRPKFVSSVESEIVTLVAPGSTPASTAYTLTGSPALLPPDARSFSDMGVFVDETGLSYFLSSADSNNIQINNINAGTPITIGTRDGALEAPGMFKASGVYYFIMSGKTGYSPNPNKVYWATSLAGPWQGGTDIAPEAVNTYNSQKSAELVITGTSTTTYIFLGDAWDIDGTDASNYEWLPISVSTSAHTATLQDFSMWTVNPNTGMLRLSRRSGIVTSNGQSVLNNNPVNPSSNVTFTNVIGNGDKQWVSLKYSVSNVTAGEAHVSVNGAAPINLSELNSRAGHFTTVPVAPSLKKGANTLTFGTTAVKGGEFEAHLEGIQVFDDY
ncbi:Arabinanase/levansucrase/invertase [Mycena metata]|uniref:Arabinanase/levansucrase/invertase n=1 Tax=Mycena metata TaxID=1033252 RepID=A0AAD7J939_9AGAR|nr:Arabinanase/levansucrase/invertase [Mycena metata]